MLTSGRLQNNPPVLIVKTSQRAGVSLHAGSGLGEEGLEVSGGCASTLFPRHQVKGLAPSLRMQQGLHVQHQKNRKQQQEVTTEWANEQSTGQRVIPITLTESDEFSLKFRLYSSKV